MYVVLTCPQTGGQPDLATYGVYNDLDDARAERDEQQRTTAAARRRKWTPL